MTGLPPTQKDSAGHLDKAYFSAAVQQYTAAYGWVLIHKVLAMAFHRRLEKNSKVGPVDNRPFAKKLHLL